MKKNIKTYSKRLLPLIGILILILTIYNLDIAEIKNAFFSIKAIFIVISLSLTIPRLIIRNYAWIIIQREQKINLGFWESFKILLIGYFYGTISPGYIGRLVRIMYIKERTNDAYGKLFINTVIEAICHTLSLYIMIIFGAILVLEKFPILLTFTVGWIIVLFLIMLFFVKKERGERLFYLLIRVFIPKKIKTKFNAFVDTFYNDFPKVNSLFLPIFLGIFTWVLIFSQYYVFIIALGINVSFLYFLLIFPVANVISYIPISFAGLGTRELSAVFLFSTLFGVVKEEILVVSLMGFIISDLVTGFIGFLLSLTETRERNKKSIAY